MDDATTVRPDDSRPRSRRLLRWIPLAVGCGLVGGCVGLLATAVQSARMAARQSQFT